jgi:hypothetical protein
VPHSPAFSNITGPWPALAVRAVRVGGVSVAYAEAAEAVEILQVSRTSAIAPVLRAAGSALAGCDYFAAAGPFMAEARRAPKTGRAGAAGRHVTKCAFITAISLALSLAREAELAEAFAAFAADERYAVAMAREATGVRERAHAAGVRSAVRAAVARAVESCGAAAGEFTCSERTACGTGACRFASPAYRGVTAVAGPGKFTRPANHDRAGDGFTDAGAAAELAVPGTWRAGVQVHDTDGLAPGGPSA